MALNAVQLPARPRQVNAGDVVERRRTRVYGRAKWADKWKELAYLEPLYVRDVAAPAVPQAGFRFRYGSILREDKNEFANELPMEIRDWYVRVELLAYKDGDRKIDPYTVFVGRIAAESCDILGNATDLNADADIVPTGDQDFIAYGLSHDLDRCTIDEVMITNDGSHGEMSRHVIDFNRDDASGLDVVGNRSRSVVELPDQEDADPEDVQKDYAFAGAVDASDGGRYEWTALQILDYLLRVHASKTVKFLLSGATDALSGLKPRVVALRGRTVFEILNELIDRRAGVGWYLDVDADGEGGEAAITIFTVTDEAIKIDDGKLPANGNTYDLDLDDLAHGVGGTIRGMDTLTTYDRIVVEGEPLFACCTLSERDESLTNGWTAAEQTAYKLAAGGDNLELNDNVRNDDRWAHVFRRFRVPSTFAYMVGDGEGMRGPNGGRKTNVNLVCSQDGKVKPGDTEQAKIRKFGRRFLRSIPVREVDAREGADRQFRPAFALLYDETQKKFCYAHNPFPLQPSASFVPLDRDMAVKIETHPNHLLAKQSGAWDGAKGSTTEPVYAYGKVMITVAFRTDEKLAVTVEIPKVGVSGQPPPERIKVIYVPGAELWHIAKNTVIGIKPDGSLDRETREGKDLIVRDDGVELRKIAAMAKAWYGKSRATLRVEFQTVNVLSLGTFIRTVTAGQRIDDVNTVVTSRTIDLVGQRTTMTTQFAELDTEVSFKPTPTFD